MSVDVDAVNERLNGLVTLLQAVGMDSGDVAGLSGGVSSGKSGGMPDARQLDDNQIEAIIRKLQQAQAEAPQIIAALEAHAEARSLGGNPSSPHKKAQHKQQQPEPVQTAPPEPEVDEDESEEDEDEGNYPMVGHGISDDISVVSDLTTPTVLTGVPVPEEEHYRDTLPPMIVGGGPGNAPPMLINPTKRKNLVSQVRPGIAPPRRNVPVPNRGGAAASRRKNYNHVVSRLAQEAPVEKPRGGPPQRREKSSRSQRSTDGTKKLKKKKAPRPTPPPSAQPSFSELANQRAPAAPASNGEWGEQGPQTTGWNAFESNPPPKKEKRKSATVIDNDGFLVGDSFDPFQAAAATNDGFSSPAGDLAFAPQQPPQQQQQPRPDQPRRPRPSKQKQGDPRSVQSNFSQQPLRKPKGAASQGRRTRRASLAT